MAKKKKATAFKYRYIVTLGDWSGDGHNAKEDFRLASNTNKKSILAAYEKSCKEVGYALSEGIPGTETLCVEYEDSVIRNDAMKALEKAGYKFDDGDKSDFNDNECEVIAHTQLLVDLFVQFVKHSLPSAEILYADDDAEQLIGGYGLPSIGYGVFGE
jgi:hypothetical protein